MVLGLPENSDRSGEGRTKHALRANQIHSMTFLMGKILYSPVYTHFLVL